LFFVSAKGIPVSTTHTITGAIVGVGLGQLASRPCRWGVRAVVAWAWVLTIPGSALMAAATYGIVAIFN
jgi:PiT family inorganic phosphate transporter